METQITNSTINFHQQVASGRRVMSYSQILTWMSCRQQWLYRYGFRFSRWQTSDPIALGDMVHRSIAAWFESELLKPDEAIPPAETCRWIVEDLMLTLPDLNEQTRRKYLDLAQTAAELANRILDELNERGWEPFETEKGYSVELELTTPMDGFDAYAGHIDMLVRDREGFVWLIDFKVRSAFSPPSYEEVNLQHASYAYLCLLNGVHVDGTITFEIKSKLPGPPKLNKDGSVNRVYSGDWETYRAFLVEHGQQPSFYSDMEAKLREHRFVNVMREFRSPAFLERVWTSIIVPASAEIAMAYEHLDAGELPPFVWRSMKHFNCNGCELRSLCMASLYGDDVSEFLRDYRTDESILNYITERGWLSQ